MRQGVLNGIAQRALFKIWLHLHFTILLCLIATMPGSPGTAVICHSSATPNNYAKSVLQQEVSKTWRAVCHSSPILSLSAGSPEPAFICRSIASNPCLSAGGWRTGRMGARWGDCRHGDRGGDSHAHSKWSTGWGFRRWQRRGRRGPVGRGCSGCERNHHGPGSHHAVNCPSGWGEGTGRASHRSRGGEIGGSSSFKRRSRHCPRPRLNPRHSSHPHPHPHSASSSSSINHNYTYCPPLKSRWELGSSLFLCYILSQDHMTGSNRA